MRGVKDLSISLELEEVLRRQGMRPGSAGAFRFQDLSIELLEMVYEQGLLTPRLVYEQYPLIYVEEGVLQLGKTIVRGQRLASVLRSAKTALVAVCTIGPRLEAEVQHLFGEGDTTKALLLDGLGTAAVDAVARESCHLLRDIAVSAGYTASSALSPGTTGFPLSEQERIFQLVDAAQIGVRLTSSGMMEPKKSISMVVGFGPDMPTWTQVEVCAHCEMRETCDYKTRLGIS